MVPPASILPARSPGRGYGGAGWRSRPRASGWHAAGRPAVGRVSAAPAARISLYGLLDRRFRCLSLVYDEQFAHTYGPWRAVVPAVVDRFLDCRWPTGIPISIWS